METKFIILRLNKELFAIELNMAREIISFTNIKPVPTMPDFFAGLLHLRGFLLPIIDMKKLLQMDDEKIKTKKKIIIVAWHKKIFGILIDEVEDIVTIEDDKIIPTPALITSLDRNFFKGGFYLSENIILILDIDILMKRHLKKFQKELTVDNKLSKM